MFKIFGKKKSSSIAKDRLKLLLISDRANCSPEVIELVKYDIINVLSKYMDIDKEALDIQITQTINEKGNYVPALFANVPIKDFRN